MKQTKEKNMNPRYAIHGDIFLREMALPKTSKKVVGNILQESVTPGNEHIVKKGKFELRKARTEKGEELFLVSKETIVIGMSVNTKKHSDQKLPKGVYVVRKTNETDHIAGVVRQICD